MAVSSDLVLWYKWGTSNTNGRADLKDASGVGTYGPELTQDGSGETYHATKGLDVGASSDIYGVLTGAFGSWANAGTFTIAVYGYIDANLSASRRMVHPGRVDDAWRMGIGMNFNEVMESFATGGYGTKTSGPNTDPGAAEVECVGVMSINDTGSGGFVSRIDQGTPAGAPSDASVDDMASAADRLWVGDSPIWAGAWPGHIREIRIYNTHDGGTGNQAQWMDDVADETIEESIAAAGGGPGNSGGGGAGRGGGRNNPKARGPRGRRGRRSPVSIPGGRGIWI